MKATLRICAVLAGCALLLAGLTLTDTVFIADGATASTTLLAIAANTDAPTNVRSACSGACTAAGTARPVARTLASGTSPTMTSALRQPATSDVIVDGD